MGKLTITFHPLFIIFSFILVYFGWVEQFFVYMLALCLHEYAHYFVAKRYGYKLNKVVFMPYGAGIGGDNQILDPTKELIIALAGPLLNLILVIVNVAIWWIWPITYAYTELFVFSNLALGLFNLVPVFPLDGGRMFVSYFVKKMDKVKVYKIMKITGFLFSLIFAILFVLSVFYKINLTFIFISAFLLSSCFGNDSNIYFERTYINGISKNLSKPMEVKTYVTHKSVPIYKLVKYVGSNHYTLIYVLDDNEKVVKILNEKEILELIKKVK